MAAGENTIDLRWERMKREYSDLTMAPERRAALLKTIQVLELQKDACVGDDKATAEFLRIAPSLLQWTYEGAIEAVDAEEEERVLEEAEAFEKALRSKREIDDD